MDRRWWPEGFLAQPRHADESSPPLNIEPILPMRRRRHLTAAGTVRELLDVFFIGFDSSRVSF